MEELGNVFSLIFQNILEVYDIVIPNFYVVSQSVNFNETILPALKPNNFYPNKPLKTSWTVMSHDVFFAVEHLQQNSRIVK